MEKKRIIIFSLIIILAFVSFFYDTGIIRFIESKRTFSLDYIFLSFVFASNVFIIFFFLTSLFLWNENKRRWIFPLWFSGAMAFVISFILKVLIARPRPFEVSSISVLQIAFNFMKNNFNTWNFSFPSFEALLVFTAIPFINKGFKKFKWIWFIFACLIAFSRVYFGIHYLSDILAGGMIGYLLGILIVKVEEKQKIGSKLMKKIGCYRR